MKKVTCLVLIRKGDQVLLGLKKRGFGAGNWNGFGGKLMPGESALEAAIRELLEESGLIGERLEECAQLHFDFETTPDIVDCTVFLCDTFSGEPIETDEMRPQWYPLGALPFDHMWPGDKHWIPQVLAGKKLDAAFHFKDFSSLRDFTVTERK